MTEKYNNKVEEKMKAQEIDIKDLVVISRNSCTSQALSSSTFFKKHPLNNNSQQISRASQTQYHPDIPYSIDCALPPIFGSQLCHVSPKIHPLRASLPNLSSILWVDQDDDEDLINEAQEALADQYDREVKNFYLDEREKAREKKKINLQAQETVLFQPPH